MVGSTNTLPPDFGPSWPEYPDLAQLNRVVGPALVGTNIYPAFTVQYAGDLSFRDREPSYVIEPNGVVLGAAVYDCRLVGNYQGRPLYATTCCVLGDFASSSSSSRSASP